jgi:hypothetical protein
MNHAAPPSREASSSMLVASYSVKGANCCQRSHTLSYNDRSLTIIASSSEVVLGDSSAASSHLSITGRALSASETTILNKRSTPQVITKSKTFYLDEVWDPREQILSLE